MSLEQLTTTELIETYSQIISLLKDRKVIRTKNLLGDLGEHLAITHYCDTPGLPSLVAAPAGTHNVDALSKHGDRYSIKATSGNLTGVFQGMNSPNLNEPEKQKFEFLIIVCFDNTFRLKRILELTWEQFLKHKSWASRVNAWNVSITKKLIDETKVIFEDQSSKAKAYSVAEMRKINANAYGSWSKEDDDKLEQLFCEGKKTKELVDIFGRNAGAIRSRIKKLELNVKYRA